MNPINARGIRIVLLSRTTESTPRAPQGFGAGWVSAFAGDGVGARRQSALANPPAYTAEDPIPNDLGTSGAESNLTSSNSLGA